MEKHLSSLAGAFLFLIYDDLSGHKFFNGLDF